MHSVLHRINAIRRSNQSSNYSIYTKSIISLINQRVLLARAIKRGWAQPGTAVGIISRNLSPRYQDRSSNNQSVHILSNMWIMHIDAFERTTNKPTNSSDDLS